MFAHGKKSVPAGIAIAEQSGIPSAVLGAVEYAIAIKIGVSALKD